MFVTDRGSVTLVVGTPASTAYTVYITRGEPPSLTGGAHTTVAVDGCVLTAETLTGADGGLVPTTNGGKAVGDPAPTLLLALKLNWYNTLGYRFGTT